MVVVRVGVQSQQVVLGVVVQVIMQHEVRMVLRTQAVAVVVGSRTVAVLVVQVLLLSNINFNRRNYGTLCTNRKRPSNSSNRCR